MQGWSESEGQNKNGDLNFFGAAKNVRVNSSSRSVPHGFGIGLYTVWIRGIDVLILGKCAGMLPNGF